MSKRATNMSVVNGGPQGLRIAVISGTIIVLFTTGMMAGDAMNLVAQTLGFRMPTPVPAETETSDKAPKLPVSGILPTDLDIHPDNLFPQYLSVTDDADDALVPTNIASAFESLVEMYRHRQAVDDNFTIRVYNIETGEVLGVHSLEDERKRFEELGTADWKQVDRTRRELTREVVERLVAEGVTRKHLTVRWGRKDQVLEARIRENQFIEYEVKLARFYGLSLLTTEIGTVETFNKDRLVSRVGARSRYQMMPAMLRARQIYHYRLRTRAGTELPVNEEWHPLLTMEAAFIVARAYANAVGHEIPGVSAYHTGPYNIFKVYREFLTAEGDNFDARTNVVGGYLWGLTHGYDTVSARSSFKTYSRGYLPSLFGALRATENVPIDTTQTLLAERVQLREGASMFLSQLLERLDGADERLQWRVSEDNPVYERFREMNPHFDLPPALSNGSVPDVGDVFLVSTTPDRKEPVRFFLPLGATAELRSRGVEEIDYDATVRYDHSTFDLHNDPITVWDQLYRDLVDDVRSFGFTFENRARLSQIVEKLEELSAVNPSRYRTTLSDIARLHERVWASNNFDKLAKVVPAARGRQRLPAQPLDPLAGNTPQDVSQTKLVSNE